MIYSKRKLIFPLVLLACGPPTPPSTPLRDLGVEDAQQRQKEREERDRRALEAEEAKHKARKEEEEHAEKARVLAQRQAEAAAHARALAIEYEADQKRSEEDESNRVKWLFRGSKWATLSERDIFAIWYAYALIPREKRHSEELYDAFREGDAKTADMAIFWNNRLFRRGIVDLLFGAKSYTLGDYDDIAVPSLVWDECVAVAGRYAADALRLKILRNAKIASLYCFSLKKSTVTGNDVIDQERTWKL